MSYKLINNDNMKIVFNQKFDYIYCDMIYENKDLSWIDKYWKGLKLNSVFIVQTDWHTDYLVREKLENLGTFVNHLVWKNEWGNHPKDKFHQCYDDILIFTNGSYKFYSDRIQVPKATINKGLNPSGRETKQATAWIDDICLTTTAKERIKQKDGHLVKWQKPVRLFDRITACFTEENDWVLDPFAGVASLGEWSINNKRNYIGIENNYEIFQLAEERLRKL